MEALHTVRIERRDGIPREEGTRKKLILCLIGPIEQFYPSTQQNHFLPDIQKYKCSSL